MQRIILPCNDQTLPENCALPYPHCQKSPEYLVVLVGLLLVWDSQTQKTNCSFLSIMKDQLTNQLANIFCECLQVELSIKVQGETSKLQFQ